MADRWGEHSRHAPLGRSRIARHAGWSRVYQRRGPRAARGIYDADHADTGIGGRFLWLLTTFLTAAVGALAIGFVISGSVGTKEEGVDWQVQVSRIMQGDLPSPPSGLELRPAEDFEQNKSKSDRVKLPGSYLIRDRFRTKRNSKRFWQKRSYVRVVARLLPVAPAHAGAVPPFNPVALYAASETSVEGWGPDGESHGRLAGVRVVELLGKSLPVEDGQEFDAQEIGGLVMRAASELAKNKEEQAAATVAAAGADTAGGKAPERTEPADTEGRDMKSATVRPGDALLKILLGMGVNPLQARAIVDAVRPVFPENLLAPGQTVHATLVPVPLQPNRMDAVRIGIYRGSEHKVSAIRTAAGKYVASTALPEAATVQAHLKASDEAPVPNSLYGALYHAALGQRLPEDTIMQVLRIHAYETDFRRRLHVDDAIEQFFDVTEDIDGKIMLGDLLFTSIVSGGEVRRFWRFRTPDGAIDYYDENGHNSKKFLMRQPVRGEAVRLTSGYGMRMHPLLRIFRMHSGIDWVAPIGTHVLAAGNGVVEEASPKNQYGNHVRIRHANGYHTAYSHLSRFGPGIGIGVKVRQGQIIGYVGNTGLSTGAHLHYEILIDKQFVDPMKIQVPRGRRLEGDVLKKFQYERARIDDLMDRDPVGRL
ncbi:MAG: M23 family metallopeptidase [Hyphomicrobiaceae bacterium]